MKYGDAAQDADDPALTAHDSFNSSRPFGPQHHTQPDIGFEGHRRTPPEKNSSAELIVEAVIRTPVPQSCEMVSVIYDTVVAPPTVERGRTIGTAGADTQLVAQGVLPGLPEPTG